MLTIDDRLKAIKRKRLRSRVSQSELAPHVPITRQRLNQAELGHVTLRADEISRIETALHRLIQERLAEMRGVASVRPEEESAIA